MSSKASRRYAAGIERALGLFETTHEWADYIAYLRSLHKALALRPDGDVDVPFKSTIALHLAQCLKPSLPSGVHQKALETYSYIFSIIGADALSRDLSIYLPGISATLTFASLSIRPLFLSLVRDHILHLPPKSLRPALKSLILSLLPGLEEENSEDFEAAFSTFEQLRVAFRNDGLESLFWQNLFLASITDAGCRSGALVYLTRCLPKFGRAHAATANIENGHSATSIETTQLVLRPEPGLLIRCFATGLQDDQMLVQRGFLDLLVTHLPLDASIFENEVKVDDTEVLVIAALTVILRRDMSLNRRLWGWFLGPEGDASNVFDTDKGVSATLNGVSNAPNTLQSSPAEFGLRLLVQSFHRMLASKSVSSRSLGRAFRIARSLMDRWEIGGPVTAAIFIPLMRHLMQYQNDANSAEDFEEVYKSASAFFDAVESYLIWCQISKLVQANDWELVTFILIHFNLQEDEMLSTHIPMLSLVLVSMLGVESNHDSASHLAHMLINMIPPKSLQRLDDPHKDDTSEDRDLDEHISRILEYYNTSSGLTSPKLPIAGALIGKLLLRALIRTYIKFLEMTTICPSLFSHVSESLAMVITKASGAEPDLIGGDFVSRIVSIIQSRLELSMDVISSIMIVAQAISSSSSHELLDQSLPLLVPLLIAALWRLLGPTSPHQHAEACQHIVGLHILSTPDQLATSAVVSQMMTKSGILCVERHEMANFATLWTHLRGATDRKEGWTLLREPLLLVIDTVDDKSKQWIQTQSSTASILKIVLADASAGPIVQTNRLRSVLSSMLKSQWGDAGSLILKILDLCMNTLSGSAHFSVTDITSLSIIQLIYEGNHVPHLWDSDALLTLLTGRLRDTESQILSESLIDAAIAVLARKPPPPELTACLYDRLRNVEASCLRKWVQALCQVLPLYGDAIFQYLLRVSEALCGRIDAEFVMFSKYFPTNNQQVQIREPVISSEAMSVGSIRSSTTIVLDEAIVDLIGGLEYLLARSRETLADRESALSSVDGSQPQGLFGSIVAADKSGPDSKHLRGSIANDCLTLNLCFKDCIRACSTIWFWCASDRTVAKDAVASYRHYSAKLRNKTRRVLENLVEAEPQECLELLVGLWVEETKANHEEIPDLVLRLLQTLPGARPRIMIPVIFRAIQNRSTSSSLERQQAPTASTGLHTSELCSFLVAYTGGLEDDLLEEIWSPSISLIKEFLTNPMSHRQILVRLLDFIASLGKKIENTNFGEESKMRRELADLCLRLLTAIFTVKPEGKASSAGVQSVHNSRGQLVQRRLTLYAGELVQTLCATLPTLNTVLGDSERLTTAYTGILQQVISPVLRSKNYAAVLSHDIFQLLRLTVRIQGVAKHWRRDLLEAFNDPKFFQTPITFVSSGWFPLIQALVATDKQVLPECLMRIPAPTSTGLMFGVGASSARAESDKKASLNLKRLSVLVLANEPDANVSTLDRIHAKIEELLGATESSAPSSVTRPEVFMLLRSLVLCFPSMYLTTFWPTIDAELRRVFETILEGQGSVPNPATRLQAAKLLDVLLFLKPQGFQRHEWLFVTDTVDAIYPPIYQEPSALVDRIAQNGVAEFDAAIENRNSDNGRTPWLCSDMTRKYVEEDDINGKLLGPFFSQLSIHAFEDVYGMEPINTEAAKNDLIADLFQP